LNSEFLYKSIRRVGSIILAAVILFSVFVGCAEQETGNGNEFPFVSFKDIPGVTEAEIAAVYELQSRVDFFVYGAIHSTEAFQGEDRTVRGFSARFSNWLSELFEIPFVPHIAEWDELIEGLEGGSIDFTGELTANDERRHKYMMTDDISQRYIVYFSLSDQPPF